MWYFASASFPCKGLMCYIFDMRISWFWRRIWHGSISGNICLIEISNPVKFDAFIKKRTILSINSWTIGTNEDFQANNLLYLPNNCKGSPNGNSGILEKLCVQALKVLGSGNFPSLVCNLCDPPV